MQQILKFKSGSQRVIIEPNEDVTDHADIEIIVENTNPDKPDDPDVTYVSLKEHEAVYLANAILRFVEQTALYNERWLADEAKKE